LKPFLADGKTALIVNSGPTATGTSGRSGSNITIFEAGATDSPYSSYQIFDSEEEKVDRVVSRPRDELMLFGGTRISAADMSLADELARARIA
jgi:hypothetical protein